MPSLWFSLIIIQINCSSVNLFVIQGDIKNDGFFILLHINLRGSLNEIPILEEENGWYYVTNSREMRSFIPFSKTISHKVNAIGQLAFELAHYETPGQHIIHYATAQIRTSLKFWFKILYDMSDIMTEELSHLLSVINEIDSEDLEPQKLLTLRMVSIYSST